MMVAHMRSNQKSGKGLGRLISSEWMRIGLLIVGVAGIVPLALAQKTDDKFLFMLGTPDGRCGEFGLTQETYRGFLDRYGRGVEFRVGESRLQDWPYIHPSHHDQWGGSKAYGFALVFELSDAVSDRDLATTQQLTIGHAALWTGCEVVVTVNGEDLPSQRFEKNGSDQMAYQPLMLGTPSRMVYAIPGGRLRHGDNRIVITMNGGGWAIYDFICLGPEAFDLSRIESPNPLADAKKGPLGEVDEIVFAMRKPGKDGHWYANFSYYAADKERLAYEQGGRLCKLNVKTGEVTVLIDDPKGGVRDPHLHYDGKKILFSYRKDGGEHYHLYEIDVDGSNLRQLTDGNFDDIEPVYLPDGDIVFVSSRCKRWVNCWLTQVANLHRCGPDGDNIRMISSNLEHENTPWLLPDGRLLYQRWEYIDRSQVHYHHLWTTNPDGTGQMIYYGNLHPGVVMIDAKPIPGTDRVLSVFSPGHGSREHAGLITVVRAKGGPDDRGFAQTVNPGADYRDPYPLDENFFLVAQRAELQVMDRDGLTGALYTLSEEDRRAGYLIHEPRPIRPRPRERIIPDRTVPQEDHGIMILANVNEGRNMEGVRPGEIKKLLVIESLPKPINFTGGMEPLSYGGTFTLERILGTVPVEEDGSACFELPALRSVFFVALDEQDLAIKRMQSFTNVQPGETMSCVGCHEQRTKTTLPQGNLMAMQRPPSRIEPITDAPDVFDFPRDIQPILNRRCTGCHGTEDTPKGGPRAGGVLLTGDRGPLFSHSYFTLSARRQMADGRNLPQSNYPPRALGSGGAELMKKIMGQHYNPPLPAQEQRIIRLWIETGAPYPGTYAALGTGMIGGYEENINDTSDREWPSIKAAMEATKRRCGQCHQGPLALPESPSDHMNMRPWEINYSDPRLKFSRHILYNLTRPEKSLLLLAPLARSEGGYQICRPPEEDWSTTAVLTSRQDPDYRTLLTAIEDTQNKLNEIKRFDMPGFQPRKGYLREMQRYNILAQELPIDKPVNPYELDRAYWRSFWIQGRRH